MRRLRGITDSVRRELCLSDVKQVSVVIRDMERAIKMYSSVGVGPFMVYPPEFYENYLSEVQYRGKPAKYKMKISVADCGPLQLELVQPIKGKSIYSEFLEQRGEGIHHLGYEVADINKTIQAFKKIGVNVLVRGRGKVSPTGYAYLDTERILGCVVEIWEAGFNQYWSDFLRRYCHWELKLPTINT